VVTGANKDSCACGQPMSRWERRLMRVAWDGQARLMPVPEAAQFEADVEMVNTRLRIPENMDLRLAMPPHQEQYEENRHCTSGEASPVHSRAGVSANLPTFLQKERWADGYPAVTGKLEFERFYPVTV
jgi:hypothetical protein